MNPKSHGANTPASSRTGGRRPDARRRPVEPYQGRVVALIALSIIIDGTTVNCSASFIPAMATRWAVPMNCVCFRGRRGIRGHDGWRSDRGRRWRSSPDGRLALIASVLLFGVSTVAASRVDGPSRWGSCASSSASVCRGALSQRCRSRRGIQFRCVTEPLRSRRPSCASPSVRRSPAS